MVRPVHDFVPSVRRATGVDKLLSKSMRERGRNRSLKAPIANSSVIEHGRYTLRGLILGRIVIIKRTDSTHGVIPGSGGWADAGFKSFRSPGSRGSGIQIASSRNRNR